MVVFFNRTRYTSPDPPSPHIRILSKSVAFTCGRGPGGRGKGGDDSGEVCCQISRGRFRSKRRSNAEDERSSSKGCNGLCWRRYWGKEEEKKEELLSGVSRAAAFSNPDPIYPLQEFRDSPSSSDR